MFRAQISSVCSDIPVHAVKLGMLYDGSRVRVVFDAIRQYAWDNIVCDPVLVSTSGTPLLDRDGLEALVSALPLFTLLTPNVPEVVAMTGKSVATECDLIEAGHALMGLGARAVLLKGGHLDLPKTVSKGRKFAQDALRQSIHLRNGSGRGSMDLLMACAPRDRFA
jgi:hydroxymethylpyrimidine/phosphomethylpyrimidine kinase